MNEVQEMIDNLPESMYYKGRQFRLNVMYDNKMWLVQYVREGKSMLRYWNSDLKVAVKSFKTLLDTLKNGD